MSFRAFSRVQNDTNSWSEKVVSRRCNVKPLSKFLQNLSSFLEVEKQASSIQNGVNDPWFRLNSKTLVVYRHCRSGLIKVVNMSSCPLATVTISNFIVLKDYITGGIFVEYARVVTSIDEMALRKCVL